MIKMVGKAAFCRELAKASQAKIVFGMALLLSALGVGCSGNAGGAQAPQGGGMPVKVEVAHSVPVSDTTDYVATLKSRASAVIMAEVEGRITDIRVHSGERVSAGQVLLDIDPRKQQATVNSQEHNRAAQQANLQWAQQQYDRTKGLADAGVVSKQDLDQALAARDAADAQLHSLDAQVQEQQVQLHYYKVVAPWAGVVGDVPVRVGDRVTTATTLTTVDKPGSLEAYIYVPIERAGDIKMNLPVQIVDAVGKVLADSQVSFISPEVDNTTQGVLVKATIANHSDKLRTDQFIRARVVWGSHQGPIVPVLAVSRIGGQYFAFIAEDANGKTVAHQKPLRVGDMVGNNYVVLDGLKNGDKIIVSGTQFLVDGMPVIPQG
ncbi:MAG TPA: efflux RND transporter periplasmic adaptor subunit [Candidatus Acidoferrum sp.]|jgi:RND family efflux transporter MFP subunit|nr:efflux RND transporter periplasmic adaptor subunit [Candidatus Acidoferrum sp.]